MVNSCESFIHRYFSCLEANLPGGMSKICQEWKQELSSLNKVFISGHAAIVREAFDAASAGDVDRFTMLKQRAEIFVEQQNGSGWKDYRRFVASIWDAVDRGKMYYKAYAREKESLDELSAVVDAEKKIDGRALPDWDSSWQALDRAEYYLSLTPHGTEEEMNSLADMRSAIAFATVYRCYRAARPILEETAEKGCSPALKYLYQCVEVLNPYVRWPVSGEHLERLQSVCGGIDRR